MSNDAELIDRFVATFESLDDLSTSLELDPIAWQLVSDDFDEYGFKQWRQIPVQTDTSLLEELYVNLPARFPPLYERLVLSYRWGRDRFRAISVVSESARLKSGGVR